MQRMHLKIIFFKLMNNSVFGNPMENMRNYMKTKLTTDPNTSMHHLSKPHFQNAQYIDGLYMVEFYKKEILYNKPTYVGCSLLDLSKLTLMKFHYDVIHQNFENKYNLIFSDTESLVYNFKHDGMYEWIKQNREHFDFYQNLSMIICKIIRMRESFKQIADDTKTLPIVDFIALIPKRYSFNH